MGTTLTKKEGVKKTSVRTKKVAAVKRVVRKTATKKTTEVKLKQSKKTAARAGKQVETKTPSTTEVVFVPGEASLRLLEKVHLYTIWYERHVPSVMSGVARVSGYTFILLGTMFAVFSYFDTNNILSTPAALVCSESGCLNIPDNELPEGVPKISFINSIPATLSVDTDFKISAVNTSAPVIILTAIETGSTVVLEPIERQGEHEYRFLIPAGRLTPASYKIEAKTEHNNATYTFTGPSFLIAGKELRQAVAAEVATAIIGESLETASTTENVASGQTITEVSTTTTTVTDAGTEEVELNQELSSRIVASGTLSPITITLHETGGTSYVKILTGDFVPTNVEVYSQLNATGQPLYLGQATQVQGEWVFSVSALNLPLSSHYLYGSFIVAGKTYQSEAVTYTPTKADYTSPTTEADLAILVQKIELSLLASTINNEHRRRYFDYFASQVETLFIESEELQFADRNLLVAIDTAMRADTESLQPLLLRYATAVQTENEFFINLSNTALTTHYTRLASTVASIIGEPAAVPAIHAVLALRYQVLKDKIRESEEQIKQETNNLTARDSDQDGISDFDEVANFGTNPLMADTDFDGVIDSVELIRMSDPLQADAEGVPTLNKNIEDITFDTVVNIKFVGPQIVMSKDNQSEDYFVRLEGLSIPNSHVYILSYSTGVIGVVKTSGSGTFSYTIEKDFAIGDHEVAAVLVDATGQIIASSRPYRFSRTENAFVAATAMSASAGQGVQPDEDNVLLNLLVAAVGVITFGFVLLLLSYTLRGRRPQKAQLA
jgi:hypothetical protein